jgi:molybdopterin-guanine dinucleotide biosynthesis protein A
MGRDKALLPWGQGTLLDHAVARLREVCAEVRILCGPTPRYAERGLPLVVDDFVDAGALGGVLSGLRRLDGGAAGLFLAVDLPLVPIALLRHLLESSLGVDAVVPSSPRGPEPLCAVYRQSCRAAVERRIAAGEPKMTSFWPDVRVRALPVVELAAFGDPTAIFQNANSPDDYAALAGERGRGV